ncbi:MAG: hypothetical protein ACE5EV_00155 [Gaiellales bacterium]
MQGADFNLTAFKGELTGRILVTGLHGDWMWEKTVTPSDSLKRYDATGSTLGEFRLAQDFIHLPAIYIGAQRHPDVSRISNSAEMEPYSVGGIYDRPIPRRIAEEAGARRSFAREKVGTTVLFFQDPSLLSARTRVDIERHAREDRISLGARLEYWTRAARWQAAVIAVRVLTRVRGKRRHAYAAGHARYGTTAQGTFARVFGSDFGTVQHSHPRSTCWQRWALSKVGARYESVRPHGHGRA